MSESVYLIREQASGSLCTSQASPIASTTPQA